MGSPATRLAVPAVNVEDPRLKRYERDEGPEWKKWKANFFDELNAIKLSNGLICSALTVATGIMSVLMTAILTIELEALQLVFAVEAFCDTGHALRIDEDIRCIRFHHRFEIRRIGVDAACFPPKFGNS